MSDRHDAIDDDIPETDFSGGVRGKYYERAMRGTNIVLLEPDVAKGSPRVLVGARRPTKRSR
jgi:hypothetical protein